MRTHPRIARVLARKGLRPEYRKAVEQADAADKKDRSYAGHRNVSALTRSEHIGRMHADLIKLGIEKVNGMSVDLWILRFLRDIARAAEGTKTGQPTAMGEVPLGGGYLAVPFEAVTLNGLFLPSLVDGLASGKVAVIGPDGRALQGESGGVFRYASIEEAADDVEVLRRLSEEAAEVGSTGTGAEPLLADPCRGCRWWRLATPDYYQCERFASPSYASQLGRCAKREPRE